MNYLLIFNPHSGTQKKSNNVINNITKTITEAGHKVCTKKTEAAGHGYKLAKEALSKDIDVIVAIGGDGTVNEVAKALVDTNKILGIIPNGSGNGLARELGIPMDHNKAVEVLLQHKVKEIDTCRANDEPFFVTCGIGFDGIVSEDFSHSQTRGLPAYVRSVVEIFLNYDGVDYKIDIDGKEVTARAFLVAVANASQYGYNAFIAPEASMSDGEVDVTIIKEFPEVDAPKIALNLFSKDITENEYVRSYRGKEITIATNTYVPYHIDGEPKEKTDKLKITVIPSSLYVIAGSEISREKNIFDFFESINNRLSNIADGVKNIFIS